MDADLKTLNGIPAIVQSLVLYCNLGSIQAIHRRS